MTKAYAAMFLIPLLTLLGSQTAFCFDKDVLRSVVMIERGEKPEKNAGDFYDFFSSSAERRPEKSKFSNYSRGAGIVLTADGQILTSAHVVGDDTSALRVSFWGNDTAFPARVIKRDAARDLMWLQVKLPKNTDLALAKIADQENMDVGDVVYAIGHPLGLKYSVTAGIISARDRTLERFPRVRFLQTDAMLHPGNSGGPLVNANGMVIGLNVAVHERGEGISYAIPISQIKNEQP